MPIREQGEERNPEFVNRPKDRPSYKRTEKQVKKGVKKQFSHYKPKKQENQNKYENLTYSRTPIKEAALKKAVKLSEKERMAGRKSGEKYANKVLSREYQGLNPAHRRALEEENNQQINRNVKEADNALISNQGRRGVGGGAAFKQRRSLYQEGNREKQGFQRELTGLNSDLALKKLAAGFNIEQGEAAQAGIARQQALDEARHNQAHRIQNKSTKKFNRSFNRV